jgi:glutaminase
MRLNRYLEDGEALSYVLREILESVRSLVGQGKPASYIPELRNIDRSKIGICVETVAGASASAGDAGTVFSIQSISKLFSLIQVLEHSGDEIWSRCGKEPSGSGFSSFAQLESERGIPRNPFVNAGALAVTDLLFRRTADPAALIRDYLGVLSGCRDIVIDEKVAASEFRTAHRNLAIAHILKVHKTIQNDPVELVRAYCRQCAIEMNCMQLARTALPLACAGFHPTFGETVMTQKVTRRVNALLLTSGMYDSVGSFAYRVGIPAKSGIGGGILAVIPNFGTVAVWSPELDRSGNSLIGTRVLELFVQITGTGVL